MSASDVAQAAIDAAFAEFGREAFHNGDSTAITIIVDLRDAGSRPDDGRPIAGQITIEGYRRFWAQTQTSRRSIRSPGRCPLPVAPPCKQHTRWPRTAHWSVWSELSGGEPRSTELCQTLRLSSGA